MTATACVLLRHDVRPRWIGSLLAAYCHTPGCPCGLIVSPPSALPRGTGRSAAPAECPRPVSREVADGSPTTLPVPAAPVPTLSPRGPGGRAAGLPSRRPGGRPSRPASGNSNGSAPLLDAAAATAGPSPR